MILTPQLLQQIIDDCGIQNNGCEFNDALVIQTKMACSIYNQEPATDELTINWLKAHCDDLDFCHSQLSVKCRNGTYSYYDYKETDDVLRMALHYGIQIGSVLNDWIAFKVMHNGNCINANPSLAVMGCISQLGEKAHAYAS